MRKIKSSVISIFFTFLILGLLILSGPVKAIEIKLKITAQGYSKWDYIWTKNITPTGGRGLFYYSDVNILIMKYIPDPKNPNPSRRKSQNKRTLVINENDEMLIGIEDGRVILEK